MKINHGITMLGLLGLVNSCATPDSELPPANVTRCTEPRPQVCTMDYSPVCATLGTGDETEIATYPNACSACSDAAVIFHLTGKCNQ